MDHNESGDDSRIKEEAVTPPPEDGADMDSTNNSSFYDVNEGEESSLLASDVKKERESSHNEPSELEDSSVLGSAAKTERSSSEHEDSSVVGSAVKTERSSSEHEDSSALKGSAEKDSEESALIPEAPQDVYDPVTGLKEATQIIPDHPTPEPRPQSAPADPSRPGMPVDDTQFAMDGDTSPIRQAEAGGTNSPIAAANSGNTSPRNSTINESTSRDQSIRESAEADDDRRHPRVDEFVYNPREHHLFMTVGFISHFGDNMDWGGALCYSQTVGSALEYYLNSFNIEEDRVGYRLTNSVGVAYDTRQTLFNAGIRHHDDFHVRFVRPQAEYDINFMPTSRVPIIAFGSLFGVLILAGFGYWLYGIEKPDAVNGNIIKDASGNPLPVKADRFGMVMDAGSVHTTFTVYKWPNIKLNGTGVVQEAFSCEGDATEGVSAFRYNPKGVKSYLLDSSCYKQAVGAVPANLRNMTPVFLGATAGMRVLNATAPAAASHIIGNISQALSTTPFNHTAPTAKIMKGTDEGVLGWVTSNYLSNTFGTEGNKSAPAQPLGALDWGGASSQITFVTDSKKKTTNGHLRTIKLYGKEYSLFTKSHLCYGQSEALSRYFVHLIHESYVKSASTVEYKLKAPCQPAGQVYNVTAKELFYSPCTIYADTTFQNFVQRIPLNKTFTFLGQGDIKHCEALIQISSFDYAHCEKTYKLPHCFSPEDVPRPHPEVKFLAFSTYWYVLDAVHTAATSGGLFTSSVNQSHAQAGPFRNTVNNLCTKQLLQQGLAHFGSEVHANTCFRGTFMHLLLSQGYRFRDGWDHIRFVKRVSNAEVGWSLGHMILATNDIPEAITWPASVTPLVTIGVLIIVTVMTVCLLLAGTILLKMIIKFIQRRRLTTKYERFVERFVQEERAVASLLEDVRVNDGPRAQEDGPSVVVVDGPNEKGSQANLLES